MPATWLKLLRETKFKEYIDWKCSNFKFIFKNGKKVAAAENYNVRGSRISQLNSILRAKHILFIKDFVLSSIVFWHILVFLIVLVLSMGFAMCQEIREWNLSMLLSNCDHYKPLNYFPGIFTFSVDGTAPTYYNFSSRKGNLEKR